jgi:transglutaminase-like putative cysteine protease
MTSRFLDRAQREASRYGSDPWVFVRELLQNARDAKARAVELRAEEGAHGALLACRDDGTGMTFEHARRFLFALYASSKESDRGAAGRFGVGFWSVLRFEPSRILVRSWPRRGEPWEVELDGELSRVERREPPPRRDHGTEVILERPSRDGDLARRVHDAAFQSGRFLRRRDDRTRTLLVRVNGEPVSAPFSLPAPSASFRRGRLRGAVGLGREARVELFARGLRVRSASAVEDLLAPDGASALTRVRFPTLAEGVAPQAILDGEDLDPLLAREDVRANAALRRLVRLAQAELRRLVERQLEAIRPGGRARRAIGAGLAILATAAAFAGAFWLLAPAGASVARGWALPLSGRSASAVPPTPRPTRPFRDLASLYRGPQSDVLGGDEAPVPLRYAPPEEPLPFAALLLDRPLERPRPLEDDALADGPRCVEDGVLVALFVQDGPGPLRLPRPTGYRVCAGSARLDGRPLELRRSTTGERYVVLDRRVRGVLRYRTAPGADPAPATEWHAVALPEPLATEVVRLRARPAGERTSDATEWVRRHVVYSASAETAGRHAAAARAGQDLLTRALAIGAGDCDVQNAVLTTLLQAAGVTARLAVGFLGRNGRALAPLHAWVEVEDAGGRWRVADAGLAPHGMGASDEVPGARHVVAAGGTRRVSSSTPSKGVPSWLGAVLGALGILGAGLRLTRPHREVRLAPDHELAPLLLGALERPEAFRHVPALFARRLVPTLSGRPTSLDEAGSLARTRRLFRSASRGTLARRAAAGGAVVLDAARAEGRVVADALGAIDLDEWDAFLARCRRPPVLVAVHARLRRLGETWEVRAVSGLVAPAVLDLPSGRRVRRIVVVDLNAPWLVAAQRLFRKRRREAVFSAVERLVDGASVPAQSRRFILKTLAREALREAAP